MTVIEVNSKRCDGCGLCVEACPYGALQLVEGLPSFNEGCTLCGVCIDACPKDAIEMPEPLQEVDLSTYMGVLIYVEYRRGRIHPVSFELLGKGRELAEELGESLYAVIIGDRCRTRADELIYRGADRVYVYDDSWLEPFRVDPYTTIIVDLVEEVKPNIFLFGATSIGRSLAPRVAARLRVGLTADCIGLEIDPQTRLLRQTRPAFGGNVMATIISPYRRPQMATVRYKVMQEAERDTSRVGEIIEKTIDPNNFPDRVQIIAFEPAEEEVGIVEAEVIVAGGKGLGGPEGFKLLEEVATLLGGAVGASRPTVDEGWIDYSHQVGLSGRTVRPKVYIACGISGAVQHLAGMRSSEVVIAINKDPDAPIFNFATLGVVGNLYEVIPRLIEKLKEYRRDELRESYKGG